MKPYTARQRRAGGVCVTASMAAASASMMTIEWEDTHPVDLLKVSMALRLVCQSLDQELSLADALADADETAAYAAACWRSRVGDGGRGEVSVRWVTHELAEVLAVSDCSCEDLGLSRQVFRAAVADTVTSILRYVQKQSGYGAAPPSTVDQDPHLLDHLRAVAAAMVTVPDELASRQ